MIENILMFATAVWVLLGATVVMPYFVNRKLEKKKTVEDLAKKATDAIKEALPGMVDTVFDDPKFKERVEQFKKEQFESLPAMITTAFNSEEFGQYMSDMMGTALQRLEGAIYQQMGITKEEIQSGLQKLGGVMNMIPEGMGEGAPGTGMDMLIQSFLADSDMSDGTKMIIMMLAQKFMPQPGAQQGQQRQLTQGLKPPR